MGYCNPFCYLLTYWRFQEWQFISSLLSSTCDRKQETTDAIRQTDT